MSFCEKNRNQIGTLEVKVDLYLHFIRVFVQMPFKSCQRPMDKKIKKPTHVNIHG